MKIISIAAVTDVEKTTVVNKMNRPQIVRFKINFFWSVHFNICSIFLIYILP